MSDLFSRPEIVEQEQRSANWHEQRKKRLGGSEIASAIGISPYKSRRQLWLEKTDQVKQVDISNLPHVKRGIDAEPRCRELVEQIYGRKFPDRVFVHDEHPHFSASLDGFAEPGEGKLFEGCNVFPAWSAEFKTMSLEKHMAVSRGEVPDYYEVQCQWNMLLSKTNFCVYASFRPEWDGDPEHDHEKLFHLVIKANPQRQAELLAGGVAFWRLVTTLEDPGSSDSDLQWVLEKDWLASAARYRAIKAQLSPLEKELKTLEEFLKSRGPVLCGGLRVTEAKVKGTVDMKRLELEAPDIFKHVEAYRKPDSKTLRITIEKGLK